MNSLEAFDFLDLSAAIFRNESPPGCLPSAHARCYVGREIFLSRPTDEDREANGAMAVEYPYKATGGLFEAVARPIEIRDLPSLRGPFGRRLGVVVVSRPKPVPGLADLLGR